MSLDTRERQFLQDLLASVGTVRRASAVAGEFHRHHGLGRLVGRQVEFDDVDRERARRLLQAHGVPLAPLGPDASRADAAQHQGMSEKSETRPPSADSVALKAVGTLELDGCRVSAPPGGYVVWRVQDACRVPADRLMVVENLETFRDLEQYGWIDYQGLRVLVIYRGDRERSAADSMEVLRRRGEPVWAFMDFDPAGLGMAASLPRLDRLVLPDETWLRARARGSRAVALFEDSMPQWGGILRETGSGAVRAARDLLLSLRAGVAQEAMLHAPGRLGN